MTISHGRSWREVRGEAFFQEGSPRCYLVDRTLVSLGKRHSDYLRAIADIRALAVALLMGRTPAAGTCASWTSIHRRIIINGSLGPWFYAKLRQRPECGLDPEIYAAFERAYRQSALQALSRQATLMVVLDALNRKGIEAVALKGSYLAAVVYKDAALRPMTDIDLLVSDHRFQQTAQELHALGYAAVVPLDWEAELFGLPVTCEKRGSPTGCVDLHRRIRAMDYYTLDAEVLRQDATATEVYGRRVFYLSPELNLIHLAVHTLNHSDMVRDWLDMAALLHSLPLDWDKLMRQARPLGVMRPLYWVMGELTRYWGVSPPEWVLAELAAYSPRPLEDRVIHHRLRYPWRLASRLGSLPDWGTRLKYLRWKLIPTAKAHESGARSRRHYLKSKVRLFFHFWGS